MLEGLAQLVVLQRLDDELVAFEGEHAGLPARRDQVAQRRSDAELEANRAAEALETAEAAMRQAEVALQDNEAELLRLENQQFQVKSNDAYSALLREIENAKNSISDSETGILESMEAIEAASEAKSSADTASQDAMVAFAAESAGIDAREKELRGGIERHRAERLEIGPSVAPELLKHYERISKRRSPAVVMVSNELCGGCRVGIPAQDFIEILRGERVVTCGNCKRILLHQEKVDSENAS
ncbi:MAG: C4-type zinc ribbon domain-containing protein [Myxococcota bacterium]